MDGPDGGLDLPSMDNAQAPASILDTLRTVEFRLGLKGYNVDEVDEYLDKAAQEAEALQEHVRQLNERLRQASERIAQLEREKAAAPPPVPVPVAAADRPRWWPRPMRPRCPTRRSSAPCCWPRSSWTRPSGRARPKRRPSSPRPRRPARAAIASAEASVAQLQTEAHHKLRDEVTRLEATRHRAGGRRGDHGPPPRGRAWPSAHRARPRSSSGSTTTCSRPTR